MIYPGWNLVLSQWPAANRKDIIPLGKRRAIVAKGWSHIHPRTDYLHLLNSTLTRKTQGRCGVAIVVMQSKIRIINLEVFGIISVSSELYMITITNR